MYTRVRLRTEVETSRMRTVFFVLVVMAESQSDLHKTLSRKGKAVHRTPTNDYQKFVNVFVFVSSGKRGDAVLKAQRLWKSYTGAERVKRLDLLTKKATKTLDRECTGLMSSFFSRAPSNVQVCTYCVHSLNDKRVRESDEYLLILKLQTAADNSGNYTKEEDCPFHPQVEPVSVDRPSPTLVAVDHQTVSVAVPFSSSDAREGEQHAKRGQATYSITAHLCQILNIEPNDLLSDDVTSHPEFMQALTSVAVSGKEYHHLYSTWKGNQSFSKRGSKVGEATQKADKALQNLKAQLQAVAECKISTRNLSVQLKSCQEKLSNMLLTLSVLFDTKTTLEGAIRLLQPAIHA